MRRVYYLLAVMLLLAALAGHVRAGARASETAHPPLVIPVVGYGGDRDDPDPGPVADRHLFAAILVNVETSSASLAVNCPGVSRDSTCRPYKYVDFLKNFCNTGVTLAAYRYAVAHDEDAFLHTYPGPRTASNRLLWQARPNPTGPNCAPDNADAVMRMNPADRAFNAYLYQHVWAGRDYAADFPSPYGVFEDDASLLAGISVGGFGEVSTEYGSGTQPSGFADRPGNSPYRQGVDWETALGQFVDGSCRASCREMALNGVATGAGDIGACDVIAGGHCHDRYFAGVIDDQVAIDNVCRAASRGNLEYLAAERPIFAGRFGYQFMNTQTMTVEINTVARLYAQTTGGCAHTKIVDVEPSSGEGGEGDLEGGYRVRLATLAFRWLVADPSSGMPDRVISFQYTVGRTPGEVPYFFEDTLVPYQAEHRVPPFVWNGRVQTVGGGCPGTAGDRGGAIALLVGCSGDAAIYCQQYRHLFIDGTDYGKTAACLNTGTSPVKVVRSWFKDDPISSYRYELALQGGEMRAVPYRGVPGGSIPLPCTNARFCTGHTALSSQAVPFRSDGSETLCGPCGLILLEKK